MRVSLFHGLDFVNAEYQSVLIHYFRLQTGGTFEPGNSLLARISGALSLFLAFRFMRDRDGEAVSCPDPLRGSWSAKGFWYVDHRSRPKDAKCTCSHIVQSLAKPMFDLFVRPLFDCDCNPVRQVCLHPSSPFLLLKEGTKAN